VLIFDDGYMKAVQPTAAALAAAGFKGFQFPPTNLAGRCYE